MCDVETHPALFEQSCVGTVAARLSMQQIPQPKGFAINTGRIAGCLGLRPRLAGLFGTDVLDPAFLPFESIGHLSLKERLVMANATTAFFVGHGTGPNKAQLLAQISAAKDR